jgi:hypothetical protein
VPAVYELVLQLAAVRRSDFRSKPSYFQCRSSTERVALQGWSTSNNAVRVKRTE